MLFPRTAFLWTFLCVSLLAHAHAQPFSDDARYTAAYTQYQAATEGNKRATRQAVELFTALHEDYPNDPVAMVLLGSSQAMQGRDAFLPWNKLNHTETGLDTMERAQRLITADHSTHTFAKLPVSVMVPLFAAITYVEVPDFFGRFEQGYDMLQQVSRHPDLAQVHPEGRTVIHYYTALAAQQVEDRSTQQQALEALYALNLNDEFTQLARQRF